MGVSDFNFLVPFVYMLPWYTLEDHRNNIKDLIKFCAEKPQFAMSFFTASSAYIGYLQYFKKETAVKVAESGENVMTWTRKDIQELLKDSDMAPSDKASLRKEIVNMDKETSNLL